MRSISKTQGKFEEAFEETFLYARDGSPEKQNLADEGISAGRHWGATVGAL